MKKDRTHFEENLFVERVKNKDLSQVQKLTINNARMKEWGKECQKIFNKDYEPNTLWYFVKKKNRIVSLGGLRPLKIKFGNKTYKIKGICSTISLDKGKGYGKILIHSMIDYARRSGKTLLGFTTQTKFFSKTGLGTKKDFIRRFIYINSQGEMIHDSEGDGIFLEGKDKFISTVIKTKRPVYIEVEHW